MIWRKTVGKYKDTRFASGQRDVFYQLKGVTLFGSATQDMPAGRTCNPDPIRVESQRMKSGDKRAAGPRVPDDVREISRVQGNDCERQGGAPTQLRPWPVDRPTLASNHTCARMTRPFAGRAAPGPEACGATSRRRPPSSRAAARTPRQPRQRERWARLASAYGRVAASHPKGPHSAPSPAGARVAGGAGGPASGSSSRRLA